MEAFIAKYSLDTKDKTAFYKNFFKCLFNESSAKLDTTEELYEEIRTMEEKLNTRIFPSIEFGFMINYFLMKYLPVSKFIRFFKESEYKNIQKEINIFISKYQFFPLEIIIHHHDLPLNKKEEKIKRLLSFLSISPDYRKAQFLGLKDVKALIKTCRSLSVDFSFALADYDLNRRMISQGQKIPFRISSYSCNLYYFRYPFFSVIRPWLKNHSLTIESSDPSFCDANGVPNRYFHQEYVLDGGKQVKDIFTSKNGFSFKLLYKFGKRVIVQDESMFQKECHWFTRPRIRLDTLFQLDHFYQLHNCDAIIHHVKKIIYDSLILIIGDVDFDIDKIISSIQFPSLYLDPRAYLKKIYHVLGRIYPNEPFFRYHSSLHEKLRRCYLQYETIFEMPTGILFPEADELDWESAFHNFCCLIMNSYLSCEFNVRLYDQKIDVSHFAPFKPFGYQYILKDDNIIDLDQIMEYENTFINFDMIPNGLQGIGIFNEAPYYYKEKIKSSTSKGPVIEKEDLYIQQDDINKFIEKLNNSC